MGRLSQMISFINADKAPTDRQMLFHYTSISKTPELMKIRRKHQRELKMCNKGKGRGKPKGK